MSKNTLIFFSSGILLTAAIISVHNIFQLEVRLHIEQKIFFYIVHFIYRIFVNFRIYLHYIIIRMLTMSTIHYLVSLKNLISYSYNTADYCMELKVLLGLKVGFASVRKYIFCYMLLCILPVST